MKLKGIMEKSLGGFLSFRCFISAKDIARISTIDEAYQRKEIEEHTEDLQNFLDKGENLFFPEIVLGCYVPYVPENEDELVRLRQLYEAFNSNEKGNFGFKKLNIGLKSPDSYDNKRFRIATLSTLSEQNDENIFFRIDGNHRILAFEKLIEKEYSKFENMMIPTCIIFFRNKQEYEMQSKIIFHNLNFKAIPLTMEENLNRIFEDGTNFPNETLKDNPSFGEEYFLTKEISNIKFEEYFRNLVNVFNNNKRSAFLDFFQFLDKNNMKLANEEKIKGALSKLNIIFENENLKESKNENLFLAFLYYHLFKTESKKIELFEKWVIQNHIYQSKINLESLINIFDKIYESRIQKVFVAMAFQQDNSDNIWKSIVNVYDELVKEGYELNKENLIDGKYMPYRVDMQKGDSKDLVQEIINNINECDLMIADLTYSRPNVYYEVGLAQAQNKPLILLFDKKENKEPETSNVHFDLITKGQILYDSNNLGQLEKELKERLKNILEKICCPIKQ